MDFELPRLYAIVDRETLERRGTCVGAFARELREAGVMLLQYRDKHNGPQEVLRAGQEIADVFAGTDAMLVMNDRADLASLLGWGVHVGQGDLPVEAVRKVLGNSPSSQSPQGLKPANINRHDTARLKPFPSPMTPHSTSSYAEEDIGTSHPSLRDGWGTQDRGEVEGDASHSSLRDEWGTQVYGAIPTLATMKPSRRWGTRKVQVVGLSTHNEEQVRAAELPTSQNRDVGHPSVIAPHYLAIGPMFGTATKADAEPVVGLEGVRWVRELTTKPLVAIGGITLENARSVIEAGADSVAVIGGLFVEGRTVREVAEDFLQRLR